MQRAVPEFIFFEELGPGGICAIGNRVHHTLHLKFAASLEEIGRHRNVVAEQFRRMLVAELNAPDVGGAVQYVGRSDLLEYSRGRRTVAQIAAE